jgi:hypothetical protein
MKMPLAPAAVAGVSVLVMVAAVAPAHAEQPRNFVTVSATATTANGTPVPSPTNVNATAVSVTTGTSYTLDSLGGGVLSATGLPDGTYKLRVGRSGGWADSWWPGVYSEAAASTFSLSKTATDCSPEAIGPTGCYGIVYKPNLQQLRTLTGFVRNRAGAGQAGVTVTAVKAQETATRYTSTTDVTGQFSMPVPPGDYDLSAPNGNRTASARVEVQAPAVSESLVLLDVPTAPGNVQVAPGTRSASVSWAAPSDNGGTPVVGYSATASPGGQSCTSDSARSCTITGLTNNQSYRVSVAATNAVGTSPASALSASFEPREAVPGAPTRVRAKAGARLATVSWSPPGTGPEGVTGYTVTSSPGGFSCSTSNLSCAVLGLTNGQAYTFRVTANSSGGAGAQSTASNSVTPADVPSEPRNVRVKAGDASLLVRWARPASNGGATVSGYTVTSFPSGRTCTTDAVVRSCAIGSLSNGTSYSVVVTATNRIGTSERSPGSASAMPSLGMRNYASTVTLNPASGVTAGTVTVRWTASAPARQVVLKWQRGRNGTVKSQTVAVSGSKRLAVKSGKRLRVTVQALDAKSRPVGEIQRTYRLS